MVAVADRGGRIRPQVSVVKAVASAVCIGTGGSVGREGPIVQIGSALASSFGQWVKVPENRMRILVACGAGGGIAATFNAPITGVFFGVEIILREFSIDAMCRSQCCGAESCKTPIPISRSPRATGSACSPRSGPPVCARAARQSVRVKLSAQQVARDRGGRCDVQRVDPPAHRNPDRLIGRR